MHEHLLTERERKPVRRGYRRTALKDLGWTVVRDWEVYAPGEDPEHFTDAWSLETAAHKVGLPLDLEDLYVLARVRYVGFMSADLTTEIGLITRISTCARVRLSVRCLSPNSRRASR